MIYNFLSAEDQIFSFKYLFCRQFASLWTLSPGAATPFVTLCISRFCTFKVKERKLGRGKRSEHRLPEFGTAYDILI